MGWKENENAWKRRVAQEREWEGNNKKNQNNEHTEKLRKCITKIGIFRVVNAYKMPYKIMKNVHCITEIEVIGQSPS